jgi:hypothetical protein
MVAEGAARLLLLASSVAAIVVSCRLAHMRQLDQPAMRLLVQVLLVHELLVGLGGFGGASACISSSPSARSPST